MFHVKLLVWFHVKLNLYAGCTKAYIEASLTQ